MVMDKFVDYLGKKQIDAQRFRESWPDEESRLRNEFQQGGAIAFELRKKFLLNNLRLEFPILEV